MTENEFPKGSPVTINSKDCFGFDSNKNLITQLDVKRGSITIITLDGASGLNILHTETLKNFYNLLLELEKDNSIRVLIITGKGNKAFCAGADIKELATIPDNLIESYVQLGTDIYEKIENFPCPVIACVNGYAFGAGFELTLACDMRFIAKSAKMGQPAVKHGLIPPFGGLRRLPKIVGLAKANEIVFSGINFDAKESLKMGIANRIYDDHELLAKTIEFSETICKNKQYSVEYSKKVMNSIFKSETYQKEIDLLVTCLKTQETKDRLDSFFNRV